MMRSGAKLLGLSMVTWLVHAGTAGAQVPGALPVQGYLTDASDAALDGSYPVTFRLYDAAAGGAVLLEEASVVDVTDGYFHAAVGEGADLAGLFLDVSEVYLGLQIGTDAEIAPRTPVLAAPYAFTAANAANAALLGGLDAAAFAPAGHAHDFEALTGIPPGLLDGDDVGPSYVGGDGIVIVGNELRAAGNIQRVIPGMCPSGQAITQIGWDGSRTCTPFGPSYSFGDGLSVAGTSVTVNWNNTQRRLTGTCAEGVATVNPDGSLGCFAGGTWQQRVDSSCAVGSAIRAIASDGTVTCQSTTAATPALQCLNTSQNSATISGGTSGTVFSPECSSGYTYISGGCVVSGTTSYLTSQDFGSSNRTFCAARNTGASASTISARSRCCRLN